MRLGLTTSCTIDSFGLCGNSGIKSAEKQIKPSKKTRQEVSYEEYVLMLSTGDELAFEYKDSIYENIHGLQSNTIHFCMTTYKNSIESEQKYEIYKSIEEMLKNVRISRKTIKEIWKDVIF